jgi:hypothetical protein
VKGAKKKKRHWQLELKDPKRHDGTHYRPFSKGERGKEEKEEREAK